jgi:hypothetical protein
MSFVASVISKNAQGSNAVRVMIGLEGGYPLKLSMRSGCDWSPIAQLGKQLFIPPLFLSVLIEVVPTYLQRTNEQRSLYMKGVDA